MEGVGESCPGARLGLRCRPRGLGGDVRPPSPQPLQASTFGSRIPGLERPPSPCPSYLCPAASCPGVPPMLVGITPGDPRIDQISFPLKCCRLERGTHSLMAMVRPRKPAGSDAGVGGWGGTARDASLRGFPFPVAPGGPPHTLQDQEDIYKAPETGTDHLSHSAASHRSG